MGEREAEREREMEGAATSPPYSLPFGLTSGPGDGVQPPGGGRGLRAVSHDDLRQNRLSPIQTTDSANS